MWSPLLARVPQDSSTLPSIGVCIPAYNLEGLVSRAIDSVLAQRDLPESIVVVDDGSTDATAEAIQPYASKLCLIRQDNRGAAGAKNTAGKASSTDWIAFLDGDDEYMPDRIESIRRFAAAWPDVDIITTDAFVTHGSKVDEATYYESSGFKIDVANPRLSILRNNFIFGHAAVRRDRWLAIGGFDETMANAEDRDCWTRMIFEGCEVGIILKPLSVYHRQDDSLSRNRAAASQGRARAMAKVLVRPDLSNEERAEARRQYRHHVAMARMIQSRETVQSGARGARAACVRVLASPGVPLRSRGLAALGIVSPAVLRRLH